MEQYNEHKESLSLYAARNVMTLVYEQKKLDAVKLLRKYTGFGIQACMAWIDKMAEHPREYFFFKSEYDHEPEEIEFPSRIADAFDGVSKLNNEQLKIISTNVRKLRNMTYEDIEHDNDVHPYTKMLMSALNTTQRSSLNILYEIVAEEVMQRFEQDKISIMPMA